MNESSQAASIVARTAKGAGWTIAWRMVTRILGVVSTLILVRFLLPADFGVVALGTAFVQSMDALAYLGVEEALIREKRPERAHYNTGFTLNVLRGLFIAAVLAGSAIPASAFFEEPRLANVLFALAAGMAVNGLNNIGLVDFRRDFAFDKEFLSMIVPRLAGMTSMVGSAMLFHSYWALVVGVLVQRVVALVISYAMHPYRPRLSLQAWRDLSGYSLWSWLVALAVLVRERSNAFLLGHALGPTPVGVYALGAEVALLPTSELIAPIARAAFSGFAAARHEGGSTAETYLRMVGGMSLLTLPAGFGLSLLASPLVYLAFGPLWSEAVPLVQILGIAGALTVFGYLASTLFSAHGLLQIIFRITVFAALLRLGLLLIMVNMLGLVGSALAVAASILAEDAAYFVMVRRHFGVSAGTMIGRLWRCLLATTAMALVLVQSGLGWVTFQGGPAVQFWHLATGTLVGIVVYAVVLITAWLASGRPEGGEAELLALLRRGLTRATGALRTT
ncbi:MAG TPA: oligosaccharide flippase family protein [Acetobacteraceae bacterium]